MAQSTCELIYTDPARRWRCGSLEGVWAIGFYVSGCDGLMAGFYAQEICSKKRRITVELRRMSMPISYSGLSRTGSMIETQRSW